MMNIHAITPPSVAHVMVQQGLAGGSLNQWADWLLSEEGLRHAAILRYIAYLKLVYEHSLATAELYDRKSPPNSEGKKEHLRHIGPEEMLFIANQLYVLDDAQIPGVVLECGVSHGYSTCCLSYACSRLDRQMIAADSFEGLPASSEGHIFF